MMNASLLIASARRLARSSVRSAAALSVSTAASASSQSAVMSALPQAMKAPLAIRSFATGMSTTTGPKATAGGDSSDSEDDGTSSSDDDWSDEDSDSDAEDEEDDDEETYKAAKKEAFTAKDLKQFGDLDDDWDEERWGKLDSEDWQGFEGDLDAVTPEGVPTWLQSVRDLSAIHQEKRMRDKLARRAMEEAKKNVLRVRKVDEQGRAYGTGRRKTSTARVWIKPSATPFDGRIKINKKDLVDYLVRDTHREEVLRPFLVVDMVGGFDVYATVKGGGLSGQAGALRHGISRALQNFDPKLRAPLKKEKLLTRDPRGVERKKAGQKKARKKFQWVKR